MIPASKTLYDFKLSPKLSLCPGSLEGIISNYYFCLFSSLHIVLFFFHPTICLSFCLSATDAELRFPETNLIW